MRFGIGLPTGMEGLINPVPFFRPHHFVQAAVLAENLGYDSVWGNDHYAPQDYVRTEHAEPPNFYEVLAVLTAVAAATHRVQLGTAVLVLPMREPVTVARQVATIDRISGGRLLLGTGIGAYREEYAAARPDLVGANRGAMLEEGLQLLSRLLAEGTERSVSHSGSFFSVTGLELFPKPQQQPFPLLVGGHKLHAIDRTITYGQGWIPGWRPLQELREWIGILRERSAAAGRDPTSLIAAPQLSCLVAPTEAEARRRYEHSGMVRHRQSLRYTGRDPELARANNLVGSPESVLEKVRFLHEAGADHLACLTFCVASVDEYFEQLHIFAEEVMRPYRRAAGITDPAAPHTKEKESRSTRL